MVAVARGVAAAHCPDVKCSIISGGMLPKLQACGQALKQGVGRVRIFPANEAEMLPQFYITKLSCGTEVTHS